MTSSFAALPVLNPSATCDTAALKKYCADRMRREVASRPVRPAMPGQDGQEIVRPRDNGALRPGRGQQAAHESFPSRGKCHAAVIIPGQACVKWVENGNMTLKMWIDALKFHFSMPISCWFNAIVIDLLRHSDRWIHEQNRDQLGVKSRGWPFRDRCHVQVSES